MKFLSDGHAHEDTRWHSGRLTGIVTAKRELPKAGAANASLFVLALMTNMDANPNTHSNHKQDCKVQQRSPSES